MFANIKHIITVFNKHLFHDCEDSSKCEKHLCLAGTWSWACYQDSSAPLLTTKPWSRACFQDFSAPLQSCAMVSTRILRSPQSHTMVTSMFPTLLFSPDKPHHGHTWVCPQDFSASLLSHHMVMSMLPRLLRYPANSQTMVTSIFPRLPCSPAKLCHSM